MNRRILIAVIIVLLFAIGVIGWFFLYSKPTPAPSLGETKDPFSIASIPKRFNFIFKNNDEIPPSVMTTEVTFAKPEVLTEIWSRPATGQTFIEQDVIKEIDATSTQGTTTISIKKLAHSTTTILMFVDRITGYVYGYNRELGKLYQISNTTIPGVHDAYIFDNGKRIVLRYADNDKNVIVGMLANIPSVNEKEQAKPLENTTYLPAQVTSVAVNKNKTLLSYLVSGDSGVAVYTVSPKGVILVANTPFKEWSLSYGGEALYATSKPSAYTEGQTAYLPSFESVVSGKTGLQSNPSERGVFLNSMWSAQGLKTFLSVGSNLAVLTIKTLASKCTWGRRDFLICAVPQLLPKNTEGLPDDWFQGRFSFDDSFFTVDIKTSNVSPFYSFDTTKYGLFDVVGISLSQDNTFISFNKKQNSSLWLLDTNLMGGE